LPRDIGIKGKGDRVPAGTHGVAGSPDALVVLPSGGQEESPYTVRWFIRRHYAQSFKFAIEFLRLLIKLMPTKP
jgi:hypothetical protein